MRTQVAIVGAGPAGLTLAHLLSRRGIDSVILEARSRGYVEHRVRAGVLEHGTADLMVELGLGRRMRSEGMVHRGIELRFDGVSHRIDLAGLTGRSITVYGQQELVKDLIAARVESGAPLHFDVGEVGIEGIESDAPLVHYTREGRRERIECDFVAGCDGFHGVSRTTLAPGTLRIYERSLPFAWLGLLVEAPPSHEELVYARHQRGFALFSMRSPQVTRLYLQVPPDQDPAAWSPDQLWSELRCRFAGADGWEPNEGRILERGLAPMRSFVCDPLRHGRLFLAGDAAHIVPPTGAKGLNLAVADVRVLAGALEAWYRHGDPQALDAYSSTCLDRIWRVQQFSWWMTSMLHRFPDDDGFRERVQWAQLTQIASSRAAAGVLAENYVGLPFAQSTATASVSTARH